MNTNKSDEEPDVRERLLGVVLKKYREQAGLSVRQVARFAGVDHGYLIRLEAGEKANPSAEVLQRIAEVLEVDATELFRLIGITAMPTPTTYFRRAYGMTNAQAEEAARVIKRLYGEPSQHTNRDQDHS